MSGDLGGLLIGLSGPRGCGKSTAAAWLEAEGWLSMAFADPIRRDVLGLFPAWSMASFEPELKDARCHRYGVSPREALRAFGEHARGLNPLVYVEDLERRIDAATARDPERPVVVSDVRMPQEAAMLRANGGVVVHVERAGMVWSGEHATECGPGWDAADMKLPNPGSLDTYRSLVRVMVQMAREGVMYG